LFQGKGASIEWDRPRTTGLRSPQKNLLKPLDKTTNLWYNKDVDREEPSKDAIWTVRALRDTAHGSIKKIKIFPKPY
jgi:hypothetical protein